MDKHVLRRDMAARRASLPGEQVRDCSERICRQARDLPELAAARLIAAYAAVHGEVDPAPLVRAARARGARVCYPRIDGRGRIVALHEVAGPDDLVPGALAIPGPRPDAPAVAPAEVALWLVPGLAFDPYGGRLGRGVGAYDDALRGAAGFKVGLGYEFQVVSCVPRRVGDVALDAIVTEARVYRGAGPEPVRA